MISFSSQGRPIVRAALVVACALISFSVCAQSAGNRGLLDSSVQTLVGPGSGGTATTTPLLNLKGGIAQDSSKNIYVTEGNRILKIAGGTITEFAGSTSPGYSDGKGTGALFKTPLTLAIDAANNLYVDDSGNFVIRKVAPDGTTTTVAGTPTVAAAPPAPGFSAVGRLAIDTAIPSIAQVAVSTTGDIFFISNNPLFLYKIPAATGVLTIVAGNGLTGTLASGKPAFNAPLGNANLGGTDITGLAVLANGTPIYSVNDTTNNAIRNIDASGNNTVVAGVVDASALSVNLNLPRGPFDPFYPDDGSRAALQTFNSLAPVTSPDSTGGVTPGNLAFDGTTIFFMDTGANRIRSISATGKIATVFGEIGEGGETNNAGFRGDGTLAAPNTPWTGIVISPPVAPPILGSFSGFYGVGANTLGNATVSNEGPTTGTTVVGSPVITVPAVPALTNLVGYTLGGAPGLQGFPPNTTVVSVSPAVSPTSITMSANCTVAQAAVGFTFVSDDQADRTSRPNRVFSGRGNVSNTTANGAPIDKQVVAVGTAAPFNALLRNDDPKLKGATGLAAGAGLVTFVDNGNFLVRQVTVGANVVTLAGDTVPFRAANGVPGITSQAFTNTTTIPAANAGITAPKQIAKDATGNFFFDALDQGGSNRAIFKLDVTTAPAAPTLTVVAGLALTNGLTANNGDGGLAANATLTGLGTETALLADGNFVFADTTVLGSSSDTIRAVSAAGVISTIAGIPGIPGSLPINIDQNLLNAQDFLVVSDRTGLAPTAVPFNKPEAVVGLTAASSTANFVVADSGGATPKLVVVQNGIITQDITLASGLKPELLAVSGNLIFVASLGSVEVDRIDITTNPAIQTQFFLNNSFPVANVTGNSTALTNTLLLVAPAAQLALLSPGDILTPPGLDQGGFSLLGTTIISSISGTTVTLINQTTGAPANATTTAVGGSYTFTKPNLGNIAGLAMGTSGLFVLDSGDNVQLITTASLSSTAPVAPKALYTLVPILAGTGVGLTVSGTKVVFSDSATSTLRTFTDTAALTLPAQPTTLAGPLVNQTSTTLPGPFAFSFLTAAPLAFNAAGNVITGNDGTTQFLTVVPGATPPKTATETIFAGFNQATNTFVPGSGSTSALNLSIGKVGGIAVDSTGALFYSDQGNNTVVRVVNGTALTVAGLAATPAIAGGIANGTPALQTTFNKPAGLAFNGADASTLFVCDTGNAIVRKITPTDGTGTVTTYAGIANEAGEGGDAFLATQARLNQPLCIAFDGNGDGYISESSSNSRVHVVNLAGIITTLGGGGADRAGYEPLNAFEVDGFSAGLALDAAGKIYITQGSGSPPIPSSITRFSGGNALVIAGDVSLGGFNGDGLPGTRTLFNGASGIAFSPTFATNVPPGPPPVLGALVFCDTLNDRVRAITNLAEATNSPPTAVIVATPDQFGFVPTTANPTIPADKVHFDGSQSTDPDGDIVSYVWDFGDPTPAGGPTANGPIVDHTYNATGSYTVSLTVTDSAGHTNTAFKTVFAAQPIISSQTTGSAAFSIGFTKSGADSGKDSFSFSFKNVVGLKPESNKAVRIFIGSQEFDTISAVSKSVGGRPTATKNKNITVTVSAPKGTISVKLANQKLAATFAQFGVTNSNTIGARSVTVPVVLIFAGATAAAPPDMVIGDKINFTYTGKFNGKAGGKFKQ